MIQPKVRYVFSFRCVVDGQDMLRRQTFFDMSSRVQNVPKMMASKIMARSRFISL